MLDWRCVLNAVSAFVLRWCCHHGVDLYAFALFVNPECLFPVLLCSCQRGIVCSFGQTDRRFVQHLLLQLCLSQLALDGAEMREVAPTPVVLRRFVPRGLLDCRWLLRDDIERGFAQYFTLFFQVYIASVDLVAKQVIIRRNAGKHGWVFSYAHVSLLIGHVDILECFVFLHVEEPILAFEHCVTEWSKPALDLLVHQALLLLVWLEAGGVRARHEDAWLRCFDWGVKDGALLRGHTHWLHVYVRGEDLLRQRQLL